MATKAVSLPNAKEEWWEVEQTRIYGPYNEALQYRLLLALWYNDALKREFVGNPKAVLERESHLRLPDDMQVKVVDAGSLRGCSPVARRQGLGGRRRV